MKSFIYSTIFFVIILTGIVLYQIYLEDKADRINEITQRIEACIVHNDATQTYKFIEDLSKSFSEMQNWIMAFEDHDQIILMAQAIESMKSYCEYYNYNEMLTELYKFRFLLNYSVKSVKPTIENIL